MANQRTKEIGIRKVMGASVRQVILVLTKDFVKLIIIAFIIAVPVAWYGMNQWLETFAYRTNFNVFTAVAAGALVVLISLLTVSYQSITVAMTNPVDSLRNE
jgi:putative ABC transport system permease protein